VHLRQGALLAAACRRELALASRERLLGARELGLLRGDPVALALDAVHRRTSAVAQAADRPGEVGVLLLDEAQVVGASRHVVEAVRVEEHGQRVRLAGLVDGDKPLGEDPESAMEARPEDLQVLAIACELGLDPPQLDAHHSNLVAQGGDLPLELVELGVVALDGGRENALARLGLTQLRLRGIELRVEVLSRRRRDAREGERARERESGSEEA
jgi:hypothetical protein